MSDEQSDSSSLPPAIEPRAPLTQLPPEQSPYGVQLLLGFVSFWVLAIGIVWLIAGGTMLSDRSPYAWLNIALSLLVTALGVFLFIKRFKHGPGLLVGFFISPGLLLLAAGVCFAIFSS